MLIYFSANHRHLERDLPFYRQIVDAIQKDGHIIVDNWVETANYKQSQSFPELDWDSICMSAQAGIEDADLLIAEATGESGFGVGFEVAYALSLKKPIMILVRGGSGGDSYSSGLDRSRFTYHEYTNDIEPLVDGFIRNYSK